MAIQNDPRLFTGGSVEFAKPHTELYFKLLQQEQAKNDTFDEYVRNLNKNVNAAGVRNQDRPVFEQKLKEWQQYGMQNRDVLRDPRKDKGGASMEFQARYQDLLNLVNESKQEEEKKKPLVDIITDPTKRDRLGKDVIPQVAAHDQPLYVQDEKGQIVRNPNRKSFDVTSISFDPKPFDQSKFRGLFKDIKRQELTPTIAKDPKSMTQTVTKRAAFDEAGKDQIATIGVTEYMSDPSFRDVVDRLDPAEWNDYYKQNFGHDIKGREDLAAAYALKTQQEEVITQDIKDDERAIWKEQEAIRQANREKNMRRANDYILARESYKTNRNAKVIDEYVNSQYNDPNATAAIISHGGKQYDGKFIKAPKSLTDKYAINRGTKDAPKWDDPEWILTSDKKYIFPVYKKREKTKGGWDKVSSESKPISIADYKIEISNDWIKSNRTANELADEFDAEGEIDESRSSTNIIRASTPVKGNHPLPAGKPRMIKQGGFDYVWDEETGTYQ